MNFILTEMTFARYFIPIILVGNSRGIRSRVFIRANNKYNCPVKNFQCLLNLSQRFGFDILELSEINRFSGLAFFVEGCGVESVNPDSFTKISLTYMTDFMVSYRRYAEKMDYIVFPNKIFAERYRDKGTYPVSGVESIGETMKFPEKHLYFGSPKYDVDLSEYCDVDLEDSALIIFPAIFNSEVDKILGKVTSILKDKGFEIIIKARGKDPVPDKYRKENLVLDDKWFPHSTMCLIHGSSVVINFGSTTIKEAMMLDTPVVNFEIKKFKHLDFLFDKNLCCLDLDPDKFLNDDNFSDRIDDLLSVDVKEFEKIRERCLFSKSSNVSAKILDYLEL